MHESWVIVLIYIIGLVIGGLGGWFFAVDWYRRKLYQAQVAQQQRWHEEQAYRAYQQYHRPSQWIN